MVQQQQQKQKEMIDKMYKNVDLLMKTVSFLFDRDKILKQQIKDINDKLQYLIENNEKSKKNNKYDINQVEQFIKKVKYNRISGYNFYISCNIIDYIPYYQEEIRKYIKITQYKADIEAQKENQKIAEQYSEHYELQETISSPTYQNNQDGNTVAMWLAEQGETINKYWQHKPSLQNKEGLTVAMMLATKCIEIPKEWEHDPDIQSFEQRVKNNGYLCVYGKQTVAMYMIMEDQIPPIEWINDPNIQNCDGQTVAMMIFDHCEDYDNLFIADCWLHKPELQNKFKQTMAMKYAMEGMIPPSCWLHDSLIRNCGGYTVALLLAKNGIVPPEEWLHNKFIRVKYKKYGQFKGYYTVQNFLQDKNIQVPEMWKYEQLDEQEDTKAMLEVRNGYIPKKQVDDIPELQNIKGETVAMLIAQYCKQTLPEEWRYDIKIKDENGFTYKDYLIMKQKQ